MAERDLEGEAKALALMILADIQRQDGESLPETEWEPGGHRWIHIGSTGDLTRVVVDGPLDLLAIGRAITARVASQVIRNAPETGA